MVALPPVDSLRCFVAGARLLHFGQAARTVALTPAAFGQRIRQLEDMLGFALFKRTTRSVSLTEAGLRFLPAAQGALDAIAASVSAAKGDTGPPPTELTLGTRQELGLSWVLPQIPKLEARFPTVQLHLYFGAGPDLLLRVRTREIDCAVTSTRYTDPKLEEVQLHREDYVFVGAPRLLARTPFAREKDAASHTLLDASAELPLFRYVRESPARHDELRFSRIVRLGSIAAIRERAIAGAGVAVLPLYFVRQDLAKRTLRRILPKLQPGHDFFRLVYCADDPRRAIYEGIAAAMRAEPLR